MSEENTTQETTQEPTQETAETNSSPSMDLDSTIKVDGEEISVRELLNSRDENTQLREYNDNAKLLISPNAGDDNSRETAIRYLMTKEGYSPQDVEEYINWTNDTTEEMSPQTPNQNPQIQQEQVEYDPAAQQYYEEQMRMQENEKMRLGELEERQSRISSEMMKAEMNKALDTSFTSSDQIKKLMGIHEEDSSREQVLKTEVESLMIEGLRKRRQAGENFNKNWFTEEAGKATKLVYDKFRSVIGDPDKIQRSPETATDSDSLFNKPPVDPPKYEKGDDMGDINVKARDWTLDTLLRGAREDTAGGESKA